MLAVKYILLVHLLSLKKYLTIVFVLYPFKYPPKMIMELSLSLKTAVC